MSQRSTAGAQPMLLFDAPRPFGMFLAALRAPNEGVRTGLIA